MIDHPVVDIIYGGQFGSESKRLFIEYYVNEYSPDLIASNFGPNSGGFTSDGSKWSVFPMNFEGKMMLSPGSIINEKAFINEMGKLSHKSTVFVHENACIVKDDAIVSERELIRIGSTMTGTMEAVKNKMKRNPNNINTASDSKSIKDVAPVVNSNTWWRMLRKAKRILLVVPQGHSLSINFGIYPYCTSRNTSPQQGLADAGIPIQWVDKIIGCFRTYPIRVANHYDDDGNMIGFSGPGYANQKEITWEEIGRKPEMTSISKKVRRIFEFSPQQFVESCRFNGCTHIFMNFMNYLNYSQKIEFVEKLHCIQRVYRLNANLKWTGYGPTIDCIREDEI